ncbi:Proteasome subunit alpha type-3 [Cichlidogyrus casuarinus]|uniref:Proteasome subunit alpha type-3 n=1 Tax=Cichlidogyrus casuarinus TaxID=1844966 RepID=A0ABD2QQ88_9PLAT
MSAIGTGYDLSAAQYSPEGKLFQIEYALKAVENGGTCVALKSKHGVVIAVENIITSKLYETGCIKRIFNVAPHIGCAISGFQADARALVEQIKEEAASYLNEYGVPISCKHLTEKVSAYMHAHTLYASARPFGVSVILVSFEDKIAQIYVLEPSGIFFSYIGAAIGKARQNAKTEIEKLKTDHMTLEELAKEAAKIIYICHDEIKDKHFELNMSWIGERTHGKHTVLQADNMKFAEDYAKQAIAEAEFMDENLE